MGAWGRGKNTGVREKMQKEMTRSKAGGEHKILKKDWIWEKEVN